KQLKSGKYVAECADLSGSKFNNVNLSDTVFDDVNLGGASFHNINMSDVRFSGMQIGGSSFIHIGLPPDKNGNQGKQRGVQFEEVHLNNSTFKKCKLTDVKIVDCEIDGMEIDGVPVKEAIEHYKENK
ncbi:unnamed protein product, partial [marine sediment metagenome]